MVETEFIDPKGWRWTHGEWEKDYGDGYFGIVRREFGGGNPLSLIQEERVGKDAFWAWYVFEPPWDPEHKAQLLFPSSVASVSGIEADNYTARDKADEAHVNMSPIKSTRFMSESKRMKRGKGWWSERERHSEAARRGRR